jgi:hypothetical protein
MEQASRSRMTAVLGSGATSESIAGIAGIVLAILGLLHVIPVYMAAIGTMVIGTGLLLEGGVLTERSAATTPESTASGRARPQFALRGAGSAEVLGGVGGIVLGMGIPALADFVERDVDDVASARSIHTAGETASGAQILVGLGAITLGILALTGVDPMILVLVALIAMGGAVLINGAAMGSMALVEHHQI